MFNVKSNCLIVFTIKKYLFKKSKITFFEKNLEFVNLCKAFVVSKGHS